MKKVLWNLGNKIFAGIFEIIICRNYLKISVARKILKDFFWTILEQNGRNFRKKLNNFTKQNVEILDKIVESLEKNWKIL